MVQMAPLDERMADGAARRKWRRSTGGWGNRAQRAPLNGRMDGVTRGAEGDARRADATWTAPHASTYERLERTVWMNVCWYVAA